MDNDCLITRLNHMISIVQSLTVATSDVFVEAIVEEDDEDFILAHLLNEKTIDLAFLLMDIVKEELDELKELEGAWHKDTFVPMLNPDGDVSVGMTPSAKDQAGMDMEVLNDDVPMDISLDHLLDILSFKEDI